MDTKNDKKDKNHQLMNDYMHSLIKSLQGEIQNQFINNPK